MTVVLLKKHLILIFFDFGDV